MSEESIFNEDGQVWAGGKRDLQQKLNRHYGVEGIWHNGDYYHEEREEILYEVLTYFDGEEEHFIDDEVRMYGHDPSGAVGIDRESLPSKERVQEVVEAANGEREADV